MDEISPASTLLCAHNRIMTNWPLRGVDTPISRIDDDKDEYFVTGISSPRSFNHPSRNETRYEEASHEHAPKTGMQSSQSNMSVPSLDMAPPNTSDAAGIALAALIHVPTPLLVLSDLKTVVLASHAMEELLGLDSASEIDISPVHAYDEGAMSQGKSLSQLGIQLVQHEEQNRVSWEVIEI